MISRSIGRVGGCAESAANDIEGEVHDLSGEMRRRTDDDQRAISRRRENGASGAEGQADESRDDGDGSRHDGAGTLIRIRSGRRRNIAASHCQMTVVKGVMMVAMVMGIALGSCRQSERSG